MSLRQMEYFLAVVEQSSFTRAAELLHVTQSALSHQIKALEREIGGALLERLPRGVRPTPMGRAFLPHAEHAVRSAGQARRAARAAAGARGGELHVATLHSIAIGLLPTVIGAWGRDHGGVRLVLREYASTAELREQLERGVADLAVGPRPEAWQGPVVPIGGEDIVLVVPPGDPLAHRASVRLAELADRRWVRCSMEHTVEGKLFLDWVCEREGFTPLTAVRTEHASTAVRMAACGGGILLTPGHVVDATVGAGAAGPHGHAVLAFDPPWRRELTVFSRVELTGAAAAFVELLRTADSAGDSTATGTAGRMVRTADSTVAR
ncbi:LysR family transcriptional regulator [Streptomyces sp. URMC 123]|uniref:LysR family transcriptional regulator n=1 Tax=Streptomyces sp. URMC 123 TaxID=3423403 RepID=UPI003F1B54FF